MKMKHNKKRNTAFIFEALIRELTKTIISKDEEKRMTILTLIRENFKSNTVMARDLDLYKSIMDTRDTDRRTAEKILFESKVQKRTIDHKIWQLFFKSFTQGQKLVNELYLSPKL